MSVGPVDRRNLAGSQDRDADDRIPCAPGCVAVEQCHRLVAVVDDRYPSCRWGPKTLPTKKPITKNPRQLVRRAQDGISVFARLGVPDASVVAI